jgi:hypothetical protein
MPKLFPATRARVDCFLQKSEAVGVENRSQYDEWQAPRPVRAPQGGQYWDPLAYYPPSFW